MFGQCLFGALENLLEIQFVGELDQEHQLMNKRLQMKFTIRSYSQNFTVDKELEVVGVQEMGDINLNK